MAETEIFKVQRPIAGANEEWLIHNEGKRRVIFSSQIPTIAKWMGLERHFKAYVEGVIDSNSELVVARILPFEEWPEW